MSEKTKAAGAGSMSTTAKQSIKLNPTTKKTRMLKLLITLGRKGLNTFEAAKHYHDFDLRTTVSRLQSDYGVKISRKSEKVPNSFGSFTHCMRYFIADEDKALAVQLLGG